MKEWQIAINNIMEQAASNEDKVKALQLLRFELMDRLHTTEDYINKIDYCLYNLKKNQC